MLVFPRPWSRGWSRRGRCPEIDLPEDISPEMGGPSSDLAPKLTDAQSRAAKRLIEHVQSDGFAASVLDGVTGSGKTEVYFEAIAEALSQGRQCLVLLPEIALTAQWLRRFEARFGMQPTEWHSDLKHTQRRRNWRSIAFGRARIVVGARSALFLPFRELGLIRRRRRARHRVQAGGRGDVQRARIWRSCARRSPDLR